MMNPALIAAVMRRGQFPGTTGSGKKSQLFTFPSAENPFENGAASGTQIKQGHTDGVDWTDARSSTGFLWGTQTSGGFDDSICHGVGYAPNQRSTVVVRKTGTLLPVQEVEGLLRFDITAHNARGYECLVSNNYTQLVRWDGALNAFTYIVQTGPVVTVNDDSVIVCSITGSIVTVTVDGVSLFDRTNVAGSTAGQPGAGLGVDVQAWASANGGSYWSTGGPGTGFYTSSTQTSAYCAKQTQWEEL